MEPALFESRYLNRRVGGAPYVDMNPLLGTLLSPTRSSCMAHGSFEARLAIFNERAQAKRLRDADKATTPAAAHRRAAVATTTITVTPEAVAGAEARVLSPEDAEIEAQRREFVARTGDEIYSYDYRVPRALIDHTASTLDWRRPGTVIKDEWFMPATFGDLVADDRGMTRRSLDALHGWVREWDAYGRGHRADPPDQCAALLKGRPGVGKSSCVRLLLQQYGFERIIMINASQERGKSLVHERLVPMLMTATCAPGPRRTAIVLEEVDGLHSAGNGGADALVNFLGALGDSKTDLESKLRDGETLSPEDCTAWQTIADKLQPNKHVRMPLIAQQMPRLRDTYVRRALRGVRSVVLPCPVFLLANEHQYHNYLRTLQRHTLYTQFTPVRDYTIAQNLYARLSERWKVLWSHDPVTNEHLAVRMATAACGDVRKAVAMFATAVRRAYDEKQRLLQTSAETLDERRRERRAREADEPRLIVRERHCAGFLHRQSAAPSSIFQMMSYLSRDASSPSHAIDVVTRYRVPQIPDMLYENYLLMAPTATSDARWHHLAALVRLADLANIFSVAERYRRLFDFIRDDATQLFYHAATTLWPMLLARAASGAVRTVAFQTDTGFARGTVAPRNLWRLQLDKPSVEGHRGICAQWRQMAIQERNMYDAMRTPPARWQSSVDVFLLFPHYVTSMRQTRSRNSMLDMLKRTAVVKNVYRERVAGSVGASVTPPAAAAAAVSDSDDDQKMMAALLRKRKAQEKAVEVAKQRQRAKKRAKTAAELKNHDVRDMFKKSATKKKKK